MSTAARKLVKALLTEGVFPGTKVNHVQREQDPNKPYHYEPAANHRLIDELLSKSGISSSAHVSYNAQEARWNKIAEQMGISLDELASKLVEIGYIESQGGIPGLEGLWELTKNEALWPFTDYAKAGPDQLAYSYIYGSPERLQKWSAFGSNKGEVMADSLANMFNSRPEMWSSHDNVVIGPAKSVYNDEWPNVQQVINALKENGWPVQVSTEGDQILIAISDRKGGSTDYNYHA